jgi:hypothetical protein
MYLEWCFQLQASTHTRGLEVFTSTHTRKMLNNQNSIILRSIKATKVTRQTIVPRIGETHRQDGENHNLMEQKALAEVPENQYQGRSVPRGFCS